MLQDTLHLPPPTASLEQEQPAQDLALGVAIQLRNQTKYFTWKQFIIHNYVTAPTPSPKLGSAQLSSPLATPSLYSTTLLAFTPAIVWGSLPSCPFPCSKQLLLILQLLAQTSPHPHHPTTDSPCTLGHSCNSLHGTIWGRLPLLSPTRGGSVKHLQQPGRVGPMMRQTLGLSSRSLSYNRQEEKQMNQVFQRL